MGNAGATVDEVRKAIASAILAGDDDKAARLMALLARPKLRAVR